jgi:hypothetical protein
VGQVCCGQALTGGNSTGALVTGVMVGLGGVGYGRCGPVGLALKGKGSQPRCGSHRGLLRRMRGQDSVPRHRMRCGGKQDDAQQQSCCGP